MNIYITDPHEFNDLSDNSYINLNKLASPPAGLRRMFIWDRCIDMLELQLPPPFCPPLSYRVPYLKFL